jgi:hypothetical protein
MPAFIEEGLFNGEGRLSESEVKFRALDLISSVDANALKRGGGISSDDSDSDIDDDSDIDSDSDSDDE